MGLHNDVPFSWDIFLDYRNCLQSIVNKHTYYLVERIYSYSIIDEVEDEINLGLNNMCHERNGNDLKNHNHERNNKSFCPSLIYTSISSCS